MFNSCMVQQLASNGSNAVDYIWLYIVLSPLLKGKCPAYSLKTPVFILQMCMTNVRIILTYARGFIFGGNWAHFESCAQHFKRPRSLIITIAIRMQYVTVS